MLIKRALERLLIISWIVMIILFFIANLIINQDFTFAIFGFGAYTIAFWLIKFTDAHSYVQFNKEVLTACIIGILLNSKLQIEEFVFIGILSALVFFYRGYSILAQYITKQDHEEASKYFDMYPDAKEYPTKDGNTILNWRKTNDGN